MGVRKIALGETFYFTFNSTQFSTGAPFTLAGTPSMAVYEENNTTEITAGLTLDDDYDSVTGLNEVEVVATAANGYEAGKYYEVVIDAGTVDSVSAVGKKVYEFRIETASEEAVRILQEQLYQGATVSTTTGNTTSAINLTDIVDANTDDDALIGQLLLFHDATDDALIWTAVTDFTNSPNMLAAVELFPNGGAMPVTVAANDHLWLMGPVYTHALGTQAKADVEAEADDALVARNLDHLLAVADADDVVNDSVIAKLASTDGDWSNFSETTDSQQSIRDATLSANVVQISGDSTAADNLESAYDGTGYDVGGLDVSELNQIVDDWINAGRLDVILDAIKAVTDQFVFTNAGEVDSNTKSINDAEVVGDGNATPWDGV